MGTEKQVELTDIIKDRKILPVEKKQSIINNIFFNCLLFIIMLFITLIINISFKKLSIRAFDSYIDIIQIFCAIISVVVLEIGYRKNSRKIAIHGIEILIFSICILFVPYMYLSKSNIMALRKTILVFFIYYIIKSIATLIYTKQSYLNDNMSDIKELVKEEKKSYIDEESVKTLKKQKLEKEKGMKTTKKITKTPAKAPTKTLDKTSTKASTKTSANALIKTPDEISDNVPTKTPAKTSTKKTTKTTNKTSTKTQTKKTTKKVEEIKND